MSCRRLAGRLCRSLAEILETCRRIDRINSRFLFLFFLLGRSRTRTVVSVCTDCFLRGTVATRRFLSLRRIFGQRDHAVFQAGDCAQQFTGFKRLDDMGVGAGAARFIRLERLKFSDGEQNGNVGGAGCFLQALANFQPAVARHINIKNNEVRFRFVDAFERRRSIIDRDHFVPGVRPGSSGPCSGRSHYRRPTIFFAPSVVLPQVGGIPRSYLVRKVKSTIPKE